MRKALFDRYVRQAQLGEDQVALDVQHGCLLVYDRGFGRYTAVTLGQRVDKPRTNRLTKAWVLTPKVAKELAARIEAESKGRFLDVVCLHREGGRASGHKARVEGPRVVLYPPARPTVQSTHLCKPRGDLRTIQAAEAKVGRLKRSLDAARKTLESLLGPRLSTYNAAVFQYDLEKLEEEREAVKLAAAAKKRAKKKPTKKKRAR